MMTMTAANAATVQKPAPAQPKRYTKRKQAQNAAVAELGPEAREGFEFISYQADAGGWMWRKTEETKPDTEAQLKANGKSAAKLPVPPRRTAPAKKAPAAPAGAPGTLKAAQQPAAPETAQADTPRSPEAITPNIKAPHGVVVGETLVPAPKTALTVSQALMVADGAPVELMRGPDTPAPGKVGCAKTTKAAMVGQLLLDPKGLHHG